MVVKKQSALRKHENWRETEKPRNNTTIAERPVDKQTPTTRFRVFYQTKRDIESDESPSYYDIVK